MCGKTRKDGFSAVRQKGRDGRSPFLLVDGWKPSLLATLFATSIYSPSRRCASPDCGGVNIREAMAGAMAAGLANQSIFTSAFQPQLT